MEPLCLDRANDDEFCENKKRVSVSTSIETTVPNDESTTAAIPSSNDAIKLGTDVFNKKLNCYQEFFDLKSAKSLDSNELDYLSNTLKDNIQAEYNIAYHLHLVYILAFCSATIFALLTVITLFFSLCLSKLCLQCPFWFYGFFSILTLLASCTGLGVFLYDFFMNNIYRVQDPLKQLPTKSEIYRLNEQLKYLQTFGVSFWTAVAATCCSLLSSFLSFIVCCRLPSIRHDNKEYEIIDLNHNR